MYVVSLKKIPLHDILTYSQVVYSLVPRPSQAPVFDRLQYATASDQKQEPGNEAR